jgi:hypothetical protein
LIFELTRTAQAAPDRCHRCLQPVPANTRRCPNCREIVKTGDSRRVSIYLGAIGIIAVLVLVALGLYLTPAQVDPENQEAAGEPKAAPPKPLKKPPLN